MNHRVEREIGGRTLVIESGKMGKQAGGSVVVSVGDTVVFCAAVGGALPSELDFFPLTMDYREKNYAAGKIPGGFFKREGRPTTKEILTMRLMDRPIRPLFPDGYRKDVSVSAIVLSADKDNDPDILAMIGASASLTLSQIPFQGPTGAVRVGMTADGEFVVMPTYQQVADGRLDLVVAGTRDAITTVESGARELPESTMLEALRFGHDAVKEIVGMIDELRSRCGKEKEEVEPPETHDELYAVVNERFGEEMRRVIQTPGKLDRKKAELELQERIVAEFCPEDVEEPPHDVAQVRAVLDRLRHDVERVLIAGGRRADGRGFEDVRTVTCEVGVLPRTHGSSLFTRGETQALVVITLGTELDEQRIDGLLDEYKEKFLVHYDFPAFSVGETWPNRGPRRREIGHGNLARRALLAVAPSGDDFPYTIRVNSDILESNGSSSMATVCGGSLALMDAGIPVTRPVAGIAMGMVKEGDDVYILSDIQGSEDHNGDLDFKVAGTDRGITALQLDCKVKGIGFDILGRALEQAHRGRLHILEKMGAVLGEPRDHHSPYAPRHLQIMINPEKIGTVIGPQGKMIKKIQEDTGCTVAINDDGRVSIWGPDQANTEKCRQVVESLVEEAELGRIYEGKVVSIKDFGCFVEILPGQDGFVHVSELGEGYVDRASDVVSMGDVIKVKCIEISDDGRVKLSKRAAEGGESSDGAPPRRPDRPRRGPRRRGGSGRGGGPGRGGSGGRPQGARGGGGRPQRSGGRSDRR
jgi:polyribonucleotide nucleotidyltransferase